MKASKIYKDTKLTLGKTKEYRNDFGEVIIEKLNIFKYWYTLIFKGSKTTVVANQITLHDPYINKIGKWLGERLTKLIDNIINVIGSGVIAAALIKFIENL